MKAIFDLRDLRAMLVALVLLAGLGIAPLPAGAGDLIVSRGVLEDPAGTLTIAEVAEREFTPVGTTLSRGMTNSVHWLRVQVRTPARGSEAVLFIRQPYLNDIRLYEADAGEPSGWKTRATGNNYAYAERERASTSLGFVVHPAPPETTYYLRLKTTSHTQMTLEALEPAEADRLDHRNDLLEVFFVTSMLLLLFWAIHSYLLDRLPVVGLFAVHQAMYTLYGVAITGYLAPYLPAGFPRLGDLSTAILYCGVSFTILLFCRELFRPYQPPRVLMRGLDLFLLAFPLQLAAMALGRMPLAVILNAVLLRVMWWYFVVMTFTLRLEQAPSRRLLQVVFVVVTLFFSLFWLSNLDSLASLNLNLYGRQLLIANGLLIGTLFAMLLNARSRRLLLEARQSAMELRAKSEFLALVSHEIRTPLNALVGFSALARQTADPATLDQYLAIIEHSSGSLMTLVNDILDLSKIEAGRMALEGVPLDLRQLMGSLEAQYRPLASQKQLAFHVAVADDVPAWVVADPVRLRQILVNLLSNALKFTETGTVSCTVGLSGPGAADGRSRVRFEVRDTGIGIPESGRGLLFQPFRQLDPTISRTFGGTGLGLAIVHSLVTMMQGSITVDSREGVGSRFVVELELPAAEPAPDIHSAPAALPDLTVRTVRTVLVIEDNAFNRRLTGDILASWGQQVTLAEDGPQGLQFLARQRFDLILLDIRMPGLDGIEVARRIRRLERERSETPAPIIAVTADTDAATRAACLAAGINAVLAKPVIPEQLARAIATHAEHAAPATSGEPTEHAASAEHAAHATSGGRAGSLPPGPELRLDAQTRSDLGDDPERARRYRDMLLRDIDEELEGLQAALAGNDRDGFGRAAHTLKGLCGHLETREPAELAAWLERNGPSGHPEQLGRVLERLRTICQPCQTCLTGLAQEPNEVPQ